MKSGLGWILGMKLLKCVVWLEHSNHTTHFLRYKEDTGNGLTDPVSRSPVSLVDRAYMELLLKGDRTERIPRMIPYQTISQKGILTAYRIDIMKIRNLSETVEIQKPWIAVMPQSAGRYPLILHRDLLSS